MSDLAKDLEALSSAEDFFAYFGLDYDPRIMAACRLHILQRFHDKLSRLETLDSLGDAAKRAVYRAQLEQAYADFVSGTPLTERVFPGLRRMKGAFVALSSVRLPPGQG
jgi:nitrogenase-stabilizing/protective protein